VLPTLRLGLADGVTDGAAALPLAGAEGDADVAALAAVAQARVVWGS